MDSTGTPSNSNDIVDMDAAQFYGLVYIGMITLCLIAWIIKEKCNNDANERLHPYHQSQQYIEEEEERKAKKAIAEEIEYMSGVDYQYRIDWYHFNHNIFYYEKKFFQINDDLSILFTEMDTYLVNDALLSLSISLFSQF